MADTIFRSTHWRRICKMLMLISAMPDLALKFLFLLLQILVIDKLNQSGTVRTNRRGKDKSKPHS